LSLWLVTRWPLFAAVIATAFGLGFIGFGLVLERQPSPTGATGLAYLALQLFTLQAGAVPEPVPWQLDVARFLAPASTATAIAVALARVFSEELEEVRLHFRTRHVVVCGLGARGARLVSSLLDAGYAVVAVEVDPHSPALREARRQGALVVVGDARTGEVLARAGVRRAACVVALAGADDTNAAVAIRAGELAPDRGPALTCLAHVKDPGLCALLRAEELTAGHSASFRLDFFNVYEQGARALLHDHPVDPAAAVGPRLAVIGLSALGQALVVEAARQWRAGPVPLVHRLGLTVIDPDAERIIALLQTRYPGLAQTADIQPVADVLDGPKDAAVARLGPWQAIFVCVDDDSSALAAAIQARQRLGGRSTPVVVDLSAASGLAGLLQRQARDAGVSAFDLFERTLRPELLLGGTYEVLARAIHAEYVEAQQRDGITPATNPAMVPWDALPDSLRESNRDQGAHIGVKLAAIGCGVAPLSDWDADLLTFADTDVEMLAELEHQRWTDQRVRDGWTPGPKDIAAKRSPYLIGWDQLADDVKELDRRAVRSIPAFLTRAGYQVIRVTPPRQA
jgi:hypothetical protein